MVAGDNIQELKVSAYTVPTDSPESDGTLVWDSTTLVLVELTAQNYAGLGYTYASPAIASYIVKKLKPVVVGEIPLDIGRLHEAMLTAIRNDGQCGLAMMALSAVDIALWDLKAKILKLPLCDLIGRATDKVKVYGSGGFTSYSNAKLTQQLSDWAERGFSAVKMKIGRQAEKDPDRIAAARQAIGDSVLLFVDANGGYEAKQALAIAEKFSVSDVSWFEEPVSSNDPAGLHFIREQIDPKIHIAAGEYGFTSKDFMDLLQSGAVDVLQADATRCGGITGFLNAGRLAEAFNMPFSFHCAPSLHLHAALCLPKHWIGEYFHDHARIENLFFDGAPQPDAGYLKPDLSQPGLGLTFKQQDAKAYML